MTRVPIVIDRIEDGFATLAMTVPEDLLPENAREGDVIFCDGEQFKVDAEETRKRRKNSFELFKGLIDEE